VRFALLLLIPTLAAADSMPTPAPPPKTLAAAVARCAKDDIKACVRAGDLYQTAFFSRDSKSEYYDKSFAAYHRACDHDDLDGCYGVAWWYAENRKTGTAIAMLEPLCRAHHQASCTLLADHIEDTDFPRALKLNQEACAAATGGEGCTANCHVLARLYEYGQHGIPKDEPTALGYYDRACDLGCLNSCDTAGDKHRATDAAKAAAQYRKACDGGFAPSCESLSQLYSAGSGVAKNAAKAKQLHARACRVSDDQIESCR